MFYDLEVSCSDILCAFGSRSQTKALSGSDNTVVVTLYFDLVDFYLALKNLTRMEMNCTAALFRTLQSYVKLSCKTLPPQHRMCYILWS